MYPPNDPTRPCRPKAGQGLVIIMMIKMIMMMVMMIMMTIRVKEYLLKPEPVVRRGLEWRPGTAGYTATLSW